MTDWLCGIGFLASWFCTAPVVITGYVEGERTFIAPRESARIDELHVERGATVRAGDIIAVLDVEDARLRLVAADALLAEADARLENLKTGKRAEEIAVLDAALSAAKAERRQRRIDLDRITDLVQRRMQSASALDAATSAHDVAAARVEELEASLKVAGIAARIKELEAARQLVEARRAERDTAQWQLDERTLHAPVSGTIETIIRHPGEMAAPSAPIVALLQSERKTLRAFIPEPLVSTVHTGDRLSFTCDGCQAPLHATVSFIAREPEYTPPVLYTVENRQKLVVRIDALLDADAVHLNPGQIVDISLAGEPG